MGNCIVTKLAEAVSGNSLMTLNTIFLDYVISKNVATNNNYCCLMIATGSESITVTVKNDKTVHVNSTTGSAVSSYTVPANSTVSLYINKNEVGNSDIADFIQISGGIYTIKKLIIQGPIIPVPSGSLSLLDFNPTQHKGLLELNHNNTIIAYGGLGVDITRIPQSVRYLMIVPYTGTTYDIENVTVPIQVVCTGPAYPSGGTFHLTLSDSTKDMASVLIINSTCSGSITNLPYNTKVLGQRGSLLTGAIEDFVAMARGKGRTTGVLAFFNVNSVWNITYGGNALKTINASAPNTIPVIDDFSYLVWDANTISWASSKPAEMNNFIPVPSALNFTTYN